MVFVLGGGILVLGLVTHYKISKMCRKQLLIDFHSVLDFRTSGFEALKLLCVLVIDDLD